MKIIYKTESGISITNPTGEISIDEVMKKDVPEQYKSTAKIVEDDIIPTDRYFRNAWKFENDKIDIDITKAKEIHKEKLRIEREPLLLEQDILFMKNLEIGFDNKDVVSEKQRLRDITKEVDKAKTVQGILKVKINENN